MTTTRLHSLAMTTPQAAAAPQQPENPETNPSQENSLSPGWVPAITNLMGNPLTSELGQKLQKRYSTKLSLITPTLWSHGTPMSLKKTGIIKKMKILLVLSPISHSM